MNKRLLRIMSLVLLLGIAGHGAAPAHAAAPLPGPDPVFSPASGTTFLTSVGGSMAVPGDFNLDGNMDFAVTNPTAGTVTILLGPGFATPAAGSPQVMFTVGASTTSQPVYLAVADFDANGSPDLVVVNRQSSAATVFKNNLTATGTVNFTRSVFPIPPFAASVMPVQVAVGDVNGDSKLDFVTANYLGNSVAVFFGDGTGTSFSAFPAKSYPLTGAPSGSNPNSVVISDLNRDGRLDLVVGANNGSQLFTLLNGGSASDPFAAAPTPYVIGANPVAAAVADMNGDLNPDVVVSNNGGVGGVPVISVLFGDGSGALGTAPCASGCGPGTRLDIPGVGLSPQGVVAGDVNGDGYPDIAVVDDAHGATDGVKILLGNGLGCFGNTAPVGSPCGTWSPITLPAGSGPAGVGLADVTGDGKPDLFVANQQVPGLTLFTNNTNGAAACATTQAHPAPCIISPATPCIGIDVNLSGVTPAGSAVRGYSLTLKLSAGLTPCAAPAATGPLPTSALVTTNGFLQ
ncbi:MAG TPA: VCBS repeat-containing protein, partial [Gemmatimonadales bacterium]|nr:VCBS repeat-containing protein [Gemmatimonadales bacterium]